MREFCNQVLLLGVGVLFGAAGCSAEPVPPSVETRRQDDERPKQSDTVLPTAPADTVDVPIVESDPPLQEVRLVHVGSFTKSVGNYFCVENQLTEAVEKQIQQRSPFRLVKDGHVDTLLAGRIVALHKGDLRTTGFSDGCALKANLWIETVWADCRTGKILMQQRVPLLSDDLLQPAFLQVEIEPKFGKLVEITDEIFVGRLARIIVDKMEMQP